MTSNEAESMTTASTPQPPPSGAPFNAVEEVIYRRRSVRAYKKRQVPDYLVRRVLEAGRFAPSAANAMPWKFIVVRDQAMIEEMTRDSVDFCKRLLRLDYTNPRQRRRAWMVRLLQRLMPKSLHPLVLAAMWQIGEGKLGIWHGAPTVIVILADRRAPGNHFIDAGIAGQNMVLAANSLGLGTCWVGFAELLTRVPKWKKQLGIKPPFELAGSIALGFPKGEADGYVTRETHAIDWYDEDGSFSVKY